MIAEMGFESLVSRRHTSLASRFSLLRRQWRKTG